MTKQHINLSLTGVESLSATPNLAVEVYDADLALAARGTLRSGVELEPDRDYVIAAILPDGSRVSKHAKLGPSDTNVELKVSGPPRTVPSAADSQADQAPPSSGLESFGVESFGLKSPASRATTQRGLRTTRGPAAPASDTSSRTWRVSGFRGNLLAEGPKVFELEPIEARSVLPGTFGKDAEVLSAWRVTFHRQPTFIQLAAREQPVWNYAVPLGENETCDIHLVRVPSTSPHAGSRESPATELAIDIVLPNRNADLLLRYAGNNLMQEIAQSANSLGVLTQDLLAGKFEHPLGAAVGAYSLLRFNQLDRLQDWTKNLYRYIPWLPDGVVILAEHLARVGEHQEALDTLMELPKRGLPFFTSGMTYAVNRLRHYRPFLENKKLTGDLSAVESLYAALERYAGYVDVTRPILTFMGADPVSPSREPGSLQAP
jgi:hypothetical protein